MRSTWRSLFSALHFSTLLSSSGAKRHTTERVQQSTRFVVEVVHLLLCVAPRARGPRDVQQSPSRRGAAVHRCYWPTSRSELRKALRTAIASPTRLVDEHCFPLPLSSLIITQIFRLDSTRFQYTVVTSRYYYTTVHTYLYTTLTT